MIGELFGKTLVRRVVFGDDEQPGGVLVEPMHDAGTPDATDPGKTVAAMGDQRLHQGSRGMAGRGVNDQACGLIQHEQVVVFIPDVQNPGFADQLARLRLRQRNADRRPGADLESRVGDGTLATTHRALAD